MTTQVNNNLNLVQVTNDVNEKASVAVQPTAVQNALPGKTVTTVDGYVLGDKATKEQLDKIQVVVRSPLITVLNSMGIDLMANKITPLETKREEIRDLEMSFTRVQRAFSATCIPQLQSIAEGSGLVKLYSQVAICHGIPMTPQEISTLLGLFLKPKIPSMVDQVGQISPSHVVEVTLAYEHEKAVMDLTGSFLNSVSSFNLKELSLLKKGLSDQCVMSAKKLSKFSKTHAATVRSGLEQIRKLCAGDEKNLQRFARAVTNQVTNRAQVLKAQQRNNSPKIARNEVEQYNLGPVVGESGSRSMRSSTYVATKLRG